MAITVKHNKVSTIPDTTDTSLVRPSDWNADHTLTGIGTMAEQNANAVAITGGTINGTTIGATTPSSVNATTITGQTARLNGTGQNLFTQSNTFTNATSWITSGLTVTGGQSDPDGGSNASLLTITAQFQSIRNSQYTLSAGAVYTLNIWCRVASGTRTLSVVDNNSNILGSFTATTSWAKYTVTFTAASSTTLLPIQDRNASGFVNAFIYQSQLEFGSVTGTYIPTTTTAVYGTPTLSFSGVSEIGLLSNGALYLQPAGTGALQAQATTSTTAGGNARGAYAVDLQMQRGGATRVASATNAFIGAGYDNIVSGGYSAVVSGYSNGVTGVYSSILGGDTNLASGTRSVIAGGILNTASGTISSVIGGYSNTATGFYSTIGGGYANSGTANAAVTTQSGTMNGTTAVTLSGSNANIKVGQLITGTSINTFPNTYVAAISGTSLTLSQNASGSSTSTLSFFNPHGVVVGGGNNQATGSYSFIGGGGDAGTAAQRNVASADWSTVCGGAKNTASGIGSFVGGGGTDGTTFDGHLASGSFSTIAGGYANKTSGSGSAVGGGNNNSANANYSTISGGRQGIARSIIGNFVTPACSIPLGNASGLTQSALLVLAVQTTDATATALRSDSSAASGTNQVILPNNSAYFFRGEVVSGVTGGGNTKGFTIEGVIKRGANAASTALVGTPTVTSMYADVGAATWAIAVTADTTNGGIRVTFTGQAATTIRTVCQIRTTEMTY